MNVFVHESRLKKLEIGFDLRSLCYIQFLFQFNFHSYNLFNSTLFFFISYIITSEFNAIQRVTWHRRSRPFIVQFSKDIIILLQNNLFTIYISFHRTFLPRTSIIYFPSLKWKEIRNKTRRNSLLGIPRTYSRSET